MKTKDAELNGEDVHAASDGSPVISVRGVTVAYRSYKQRPTSVKESALRFLRTGVLKHYETFNALEDVSFEVEKGKVFGIIGSNGSGKSTLLKVLARVLVPTKGEVSVEGRMTSLIELGAGFDPELSAVENIYLNGSLHRKTKAEIEERVEHILEFANLTEFATTPIKYYSSGMYARLGFSVAVDIDPDILVVDEILAVGDERFQRKCQGVFATFLESGKTVVMVSHDLSMLQSVADRVAVLSRGQLVYVGDPKTAVEMYRDSSYRAALETVPAVRGASSSMVHETARAGAVKPARSSSVVVRNTGKSILCFLNHFHGDAGECRGKSAAEGVAVRRGHVEHALQQLRRLTSIGQIDVKVCGMRDRALVPVDIDFSDLHDPALLVYESLHRMTEFIGRYDYFINLEEDISIPEETLAAIIEFDKNALVNECLHPNRIEIRDGVAHCVDLEALPGWTTQRLSFAEQNFKVALNPHSGLLILSTQKLKYALSQIDLSFRGRVIGGPISSAYAHFHSPFSLYRSCDDLAFHSVVHLDHWVPQVVAQETEPSLGLVEARAL